MSELNTQAQIIELTDEQLELVEGGRSQTANHIFNVVPVVGAANWLSEVLGGPTLGDLF